ncbi:Putative tetratricopeptide-like helical domain superfamily [Septoria linicola]|uniref:Tetratricopeptide-like helical domain superfamily n=1 Tax=Septoria linicola TaxID=215465 RepID=A0A9Q9ALU6_9PEZI|nr:Putative tetratricopeptide-like helical domain superfamily [Septoria linicola]
MEAFLRNWRQDALNRHQYDSAIFVGDKLLALTDADEDAYALAQTHFSAGNYTRASSLLSRSEVLQRSPASRYLAAHCAIRQGRHADALTVLGEGNPVHLATTADAQRRKLQHIGNGLHSTLLQQPSILPRRTERVERVDRSAERDLEDSTHLRYEAGMCYLRGLCYAQQNALDRAKDCYKDAVRIDVQCFEAFEQLVKNSLMSPAEEWHFLDSLDFDSIRGDSEAADFTRNLYSTRLSKYARPDDFDAAIETLSTHYTLSQNPDILLAKAEKLFTASRFQAAVDLTTRILEADPSNFACVPLHLALLAQLDHTHALFSLSHALADTHPDEPCTWLAVGTYYLTTNRIPEARSYFSKASLMDPHFGAAWIGFAHTFAAEGESDQAIAAYSTAARLFQGTHLPQLFLGMQEIALGNLTIAREYLTAAYTLCQRDPLLINEIGMVCYMEGAFDSAIDHFNLALQIAADNEAPQNQYTTTRLNLAHALRKALRFHEALEQFEQVVRLGLRDTAVLASKGLVLMELDDPFQATVALHEALAISPQDPLATDLLEKALRQLENQGVLGGADEDLWDQGIATKVNRIRHVRGATGSRRRRVIRQLDDSMELDGASGRASAS